LVLHIMYHWHYGFSLFKFFWNVSSCSSLFHMVHSIIEYTRCRKLFPIVLKFLIFL
jgi:hypothetical protein